MTTVVDYSILSLYVYDVVNKGENRTQLPSPEWSALPGHPVKDDANGFSYGIFQNSSSLES